MKKYGNPQRWNHIKHFVTTHPYSEDNLDYLKNWIDHFEDVGVALHSPPTPPESMTTKPDNIEECSHISVSDNHLPRTKKFSCYWESDGWCQHRECSFKQCVMHLDCPYYKPITFGVKQ